MKATLQFDLEDPDDRVSHLRCVKSLDLAHSIYSITSFLRQRLKIETLSIKERKLYENVRNEFNNILVDNNINLEEIYS